MTRAAPKRNRPRVWDDAQVIAWIVRRTERAVNDAGGLLLHIARNRPFCDDREKTLSLALPLAILFEHDKPYFVADGAPATGMVAGRYATAEKQFEDAVAEGRLRPREKDRLYNHKDVKALWPSTGSGNSEKQFLDRDLVVKAAAVIARGSDDQTRTDMFRAIGSKGLIKKENQRGLLLAATDKVTREHENAGDPRATTPSEANDLLRQGGAPERARKGLEYLARIKELPPEEREAEIQRVKAFKKRTLRAKNTASD